MSDATATTAEQTSRRVRAVVLLAQPPATIGEVLDVLQPGMGANIQGVPLQGISVAVNGFAVAFELDGQPLVARELDYAVTQSPMRALVEKAVAEHRGFLTLTVAADHDVFGASQLLANVTATYARDANGLAVWLPDADQATTDVLYAGEAAQRSAQVWFHTMAARIDDASSIAHTIGVRHLGGIDVQLRSTLAPADAHDALRDAVATLLEARTMPAAGATVVIGGVPHVLQPAQSMLQMGDVLDAQPVAGAATTSGDAAAERPSAWKRFFGRS